MMTNYGANFKLVDAYLYDHYLWRRDMGRNVGANRHTTARCIGLKDSLIVLSVVAQFGQLLSNADNR